MTLFKHSSLAILFLAIYAISRAQAPPETSVPVSSLEVNSRAVLVDVIVTDHAGKPVTGLKRDAFTVTEQGTPQTISFFEENGPASITQPAEMPKMPPDIFTNFSPFPQPPAVNVLLLDSLNTHIASQSFVHSQAMKFLKSAKPGTRSAIFTMGLSLHFIQGFNDDPAALAAALSNKRNNEVETSVMLKGQAETNAQEKLAGMMSTAGPGMVASLQQFFAENDASSDDDRMLITLANLQRLAAFLEGFPGRKNIIWFVEEPPGIMGPHGAANPAIGDEVKKTLARLATARAAIYPVDARGISINAQYTAENNPNGGGDVHGNAISKEDEDRDSDQIHAQLLAEQSGGKAFANANNLADILDKVTSESDHFYTLSYSPSDAKMDGAWRKISIKVKEGNYNLSYRRGYFAADADLPGSAMSVRNQKVQKLAAQSLGAVDPLLPFMDLGMPQSEQILYKIRILPIPSMDIDPADGKKKVHYKIDFAVDINDLRLPLDKDGVRKGTLNVALIAYDRYRNIISREDHVVALNIKPDVYGSYQQTGLQLQAKIAVPKGNFWLRTGFYDQGSRKVGTMEVPLSAVTPLAPAASR
jgi:VWFA-related protein